MGDGAAEGLLSNRRWGASCKCALGFDTDVKGSCSLLDSVRTTLLRNHPVIWVVALVLTADDVVALNSILEAAAATFLSGVLDLFQKLTVLPQLKEKPLTISCIMILFSSSSTLNPEP